MINKISNILFFVLCFVFVASFVFSISSVSFVDPTPENDSWFLYDYNDSITVKLDTNVLIDNQYLITSLNDSLVGFWRFEDDFNLDSSDLNYDLNNQGVISDNGVFGNSGYFDNNNYVYVTDVNGLSNNSPYSVSLWFKASEDNNSGNIFFLSDSDYAWRMPLLAIEDYNLFAANYCSPDCITEEYPINPNEWYNAIMTWNSDDGLKLYVNGELVGQVAGPYDSNPLPSTSTVRIYLGYEAVDGAYLSKGAFKGNIDEVAIFNYVLDENEIQMLYDSTTTYQKSYDLEYGSNNLKSYFITSDDQTILDRNFEVGFILPDNDEDNYWDINSCENLQLIKDYADGNYNFELVNDIDCSDTNTWNYLEILEPYCSNDYYENEEDCQGTNNYWYTESFFQGFEPIGDGDTPFTGNFNGNNYTISNLYINRPGLWGVGLFGYVEPQNSQLTISNLNLENVYITGKSSTGAVVGSIYSSEDTMLLLNNISVLGTISGTYGVGGILGSTCITNFNNLSVDANINGRAGIGGIVGTIGGECSSYSQIGESYFNGTITSSNVGETDIGGLVGEITTNWDETSSISKSFADVNIYAPDSNYIGGLIGNAIGTIGVDISQSYSLGVIIAESYVGGLIGNITIAGNITNSYSRADVNGKYFLGGLIGAADTLTTFLSYSYSTGNVNGIDIVGGLFGYASGSWVGSNFSTSIITVDPDANYFGTLFGRDISSDIGANYWYYNTDMNCAVSNNDTACAYSTAIGNEDGNDISYFYDSANMPLDNWDFDSIWFAQEDDYPVLGWSVLTYDKDNDNYYDINSCQELQAMKYDLDKNYELVGNIDCSDTNTWNYFEISEPNCYDYFSEIVGGRNQETCEGSGYYWFSESFYNGFEPIGNNDNQFTGSFNGNGYVINNLYINIPNEWYVGLFGYVNNSNISDVNIVDAYIVGGGNGVGSLLGYGNYDSDVNIKNCFSSADINGGRYVGGLIGRLEIELEDNQFFEINNSSSSGNLTSRESGEVGGLIGKIYFESDAIDANFKIKNSNSSVNIDLNKTGYIDSTGGLIGYFEMYSDYDDDSELNILIENSYSTGNIVINNIGDQSVGIQDIGGLIGYLDVECYDQYYFRNINILNSYSTSNLYLSQENNDGYVSYIGGLIGLFENDYCESSPLIYQSYYDGAIIITHVNPEGIVEDVGGLVGTVDLEYSGLNIEESYSNVNIDAQNGVGVGGLLGTYYGDESANILDSYANVDLNANNYIAGFVGKHSSSDINILNSYATGTMIGSNLGGFVGSYNLTLNNSFNTIDFNVAEEDGGISCYDYDNFDADNIWWYNESYSQEYFDVDYEWMNKATNYSDFYDASNAPMTEWNFETVWLERDNNYPILRWQVVVDENESEEEIVTPSLSNGAKTLTVTTNGIFKDIRNGQIINFIVDKKGHHGDRHKLIIKDINTDSNNVEFDLYSTPMNYTLGIGESIKRDYDNDGNYDLSVKLLSIENGKASFEFKAINDPVILIQNNEFIIDNDNNKIIVNNDSKIIVDSNEINKINNNDDNVIVEGQPNLGKESQNNSILYWLIGIVLIFVIIAIIVYKYMRKGNYF